MLELIPTASSMSLPMLVQGFSWSVRLVAIGIVDLTNPDPKTAEYRE